MTARGPADAGEHVLTPARLANIQRIADRRRQHTGLHQGYRWVRRPDHPRADRQGKVFEHVIVVEAAMGKPLPGKYPVHHINENRSDNRPENLVVCESLGYHQLLHRRMEARAACGNANWRVCAFCKRYDDPNVMESFGGRMGKRVIHPDCRGLLWKADAVRRNGLPQPDRTEYMRGYWLNVAKPKLAALLTRPRDAAGRGTP